jgi:PAS domain S-box-containing protein
MNEHPTILVVEDEQIVAADIQSRLEQYGYRVPGIISSGEEALRRIGELRPDLLLMDIVLEGPLDGIQTVQEIRSQHDVPVVYLTAYTDEETVRRAKATRPQGLVIKPFDERELRNTIEIALQNHAAERELRRTEEIFREIAEHSDRVQFLLDAELTTTLYANAAFESVLGQQRPLPGSGLGSWLSQVHADDGDRVRAFFELARLGRSEAAGIEFRIRRPDGTQRWLWMHCAPVRGERGEVRRIAGAISDITSQRWAWETLQESEERYRLLAEHAGDVLSRHNGDGVFLYASPASAAVLGYRPEELLGHSLAEFIEAEDLRRILEAHGTLHEAFRSGRLAYRFQRADGAAAWIETTAAAVRGTPTGDILEFSLVSRALTGKREPAAAGDIARHILDAAREMIALVGQNYGHLLVNEAYCKRLGRSREDLAGRTLEEVWGEPAFSTVLKGPVDAALRGTASEFESWFTFEQSGRRCLVIRVAPSREEGADRLRCVFAAEDVTDRLSAEEQARATAKEKELLLKDLHHRVKNNLQVIASLLNLQLNVISNRETRELVRESQNRIRSMALVHEKLYQSESAGEIPMEEYLRSLTRELFRSYSLSGVHLKFDVEPLRLTIECAVPCGLMVNELVSNALKYAFPDGRTGEIHVKCFRTARDRVALSVADDGIGLPESLNLKTATTLGFQLINMLVRQLKGTLDIVRDGGCTFLITFPTR